MRAQRPLRTRQRRSRIIRRRFNVGIAERWMSLAGGGTVLGIGLWRRGIGGLLLGLLGGLLLFRGMSGYCPLYGRLRISTARPGKSGLWGQHLVHVQSRITVQQPREAVYRYWRNLENLPRFMRHIRQVRVDGNRSHWIAAAPFGLHLTWDAQIIQDSPNERLTWCSIPGSDVESRGEVRFRPTISGGTEIDVDMYYRPPGGTASRLFARLFGGISEKAVRRDLERFKGAIEQRPEQPPPEQVEDQGLGGGPTTPAHG